MKKIPLYVALFALLVCGCKKDNNTPKSNANLEVTITCSCTFDLMLTQRQNSTLQTFSIATETGIANRYDISSLVGSSKDLVEIKVHNASVTPFVVNVNYKGASIYNQNYGTDNGCDAKVYVP